MTNREKYLKDNVNLHEFAREVATGMTGEKLYDTDTLALANKIIEVLSCDADALSETEKEDLERMTKEVIRVLKDKKTMIQGLTSDRNRWYYHLTGGAIELELCIRKVIKKEE